MKRASAILILLVVCGLALVGGSTAEEDVRISTMFFQEDIREALTELMLQTGTNIIFDDTVSGTVTLDLEDVPLERALEMILMAGGYSYRQIDDYYIVGLPDPRSELFGNLTEMETITLQYVTVAEARGLLPVHYDRYLRSSTSDDYTMTITAPQAVTQRLKEDLEQIDVPQQEIMIQAIVTELSLEALDELGGTLFQWSTEGFPDWDADGLFSIGLPSPGNLSLESGLFGTLEATLRAMEQDDQVDIRANPQIRTVDRNTADLFVGDTRHIILTPEGAASRLEQVNVGVSLEVTPRIVDGERIHLTVVPEISHMVSERREDLVVRRSEMSTSLYLENGQTAMLAGMTIEELLEQERKVPILGDIPLLRLLFRQTTERVSERELLVFITAEIIEKGSQ